MFSLPECATWLAAGVVISVTIVSLNLITIIVSIRNRNLLKRGTYLVVNLAVADVLAGGVAPYFLVFLVVAECTVWDWHSSQEWRLLLAVLLLLFLVASQENITIISIERLHATFWPLRQSAFTDW